MSETINVGLKGQEGKVILQFYRDVNGQAQQADVRQWILDPENCRMIAERMTKIADDLDNSSNIVQVDKMESRRMVLTQRLAVILNSTREDKRISNGSLAKSLVDTCLAEIL